MEQEKIENISITNWLLTLLLLSIPIANLVTMIALAVDPQFSPIKRNFAMALLIYSGVWCFLVFWVCVSSSLR